MTGRGGGYRAIEWKWKCNIAEEPGFRLVEIHSARLEYISKLKKKSQFANSVDISHPF